MLISIYSVKPVTYYLTDVTHEATESLWKIVTLAMDKHILDILTDYQISSFGKVTHTELSRALKDSISHDKFTRFLSGEDFTGKQLWEYVKRTVREVEQGDAIIAMDDSVAEKEYSDENELVTWHYDHSKGRSVKGMNILSALYYSKGMSLPIGMDLVRKTAWAKDEKTGREKRVSERTKNEMYRDILRHVADNQVKFKWVVNDVWYASAENMVFVKGGLDKDFVMPVKNNRKVALTLPDKNRGCYVGVESLSLGPGMRQQVYLEGVTFPVHLIKEVYVNEDNSTASLYLVCSDLTQTFQQIITIYEKRWKVEEYHKSLKSNVALCGSPAHTVRTQANHVFTCLIAFIKLEKMKVNKKLNHFAMKAILYTKAMEKALTELKKLKAGTQLKLNFA